MSFARSGGLMVFVVAVILLAALPTFAEGNKVSAHDFAFTAIEGGPLPLSSFDGKVVLLVNTASRCGYTHQYGDLQAVWARYRDRGLVVLGVPSNDFGGQEPGKEAEIKEFCEVNFDVDFPLTAKEQVTGAGAHPFYRWAGAELGAKARPRWNFHKYLIAADGSLAGWFPTKTAPSAAEVIAAIEAELAKAGRPGS
jgi:glutathione peroxidase